MINILHVFSLSLLFTSLLNLSCKKEEDFLKLINNDPKDSIAVIRQPEDTISKVSNKTGCDGQLYPDPTASLYILPFEVGSTFTTGLTNCSSSFHGPGQPDQYAYDFNMPEGTSFIAARAGKVVHVQENQPSGGGGQGNFMVINHGDGTYALYYHSPKNGIKVKVGQEVEQGEVLGETGMSGLAGYPHLHFIVVSSQYMYPYSGLAISFKNASPLHVPLKGSTQYLAQPF